MNYRTPTLAGLYTGMDRIYDERRASRSSDPECAEMPDWQVAQELRVLSLIFDPAHRHRRTIERAIDVFCNRNRVSIPKDVRQEVIERQGQQCSYCGTTEGQLHFDHIFPVIRGGTNEANNLTMACGPCNMSKGSKTLSEWMASCGK